MTLAKSNEINQICEIAEAFAAEFEEVNIVYLHGSLLYGYERNDSDVDLAVIINHEKKKEHLRLQIHFNEFFDLRFKKREIDLKIINSASLAFKFSIVQKGKIIFSRDEEITADFEVGVVKKYLDFKPYYDAYNKAFINGLAKEGKF